MAKIIHTTDSIKLTPENEAHLQAVAGKFGWEEIKDIHIYTPVEQPTELSPETRVWAIEQLPRWEEEKKRLIVDLRQGIHEAMTGDTIPASKLLEVLDEPTENINETPSNPPS